MAGTLGGRTMMALHRASTLGGGRLLFVLILILVLLVDDACVGQSRLREKERPPL